MPSKFGGIPVEEQARSKFGGIPVDDKPEVIRGVERLSGGVAPGVPKLGLPSPATPHWWEPGSANQPGQQRILPPKNIEALGGPIFPSAQIAQIAPTMVGYGVSRLGENLNLPGWVNTIAGLAATGITGGGMSLAGKVKALPEESQGKLAKTAIDMIPWAGKKINALRGALTPTPEPFSPVRPNPGVANKMRFGGLFDMSGGKSYPGVGMSGAPEAPTAAPFEPNPPLRPNPAIAAKMRFGGPLDTSGGPAYGPPVRANGPIVSFEPPPDPEPFSPFKRNPRIARTLGKGRSAEDYNTPAYGSIPVRQTGTPAADLPPLKFPTDEQIPKLNPYTGPAKVNPNIAKKLRFTPGGEDQFKGSAGDQPSSTLGTKAEMMRQMRLKSLYLRNQNMPNGVE